MGGRTRIQGGCDRKLPTSAPLSAQPATSFEAVKRLILLRHAKSDWTAESGSDHSRPLNERGMASARAIGVALARSDQAPDLVVSSSALRAQSTAFLAADTGGWNCEIRITDELYGTSTGSVLSIVSDTADEVVRLMLVGHEPTWSTTAGVLIGGGRVRVTTGSAVAIDLPSWELAEPGRGELAWMLTPRLFTDGEWDLGG